MTPEFIPRTLLTISGFLGAVFLLLLRKKQISWAAVCGFSAYIFFALSVSLYIDNIIVSRNLRVQMKPKLRVSIRIPSEVLEYRNLLRKYPVEQYILGMSNENKNSAEVKDLSIEFHFPNIISDNRESVYMDTGGNLVIGMRGWIHGKPFYEQSHETPASKAMTLSIHKWVENNVPMNSNIALFNCKKWPRRAIFDGTIVTKLDEKPRFVKLSDKMGTYSGQFYYEIQGKRYEEKIHGVIPSPNTDIRFAEHYYEVGLELMKKADYNGAILKFDETLRLNRKHAHAHFIRAQCCGTLGNHREAFSGFSRVIDISPKYKQAYFYRAVARKKLGHARQEIENDLDRACSLKFDKACKELWHLRSLRLEEVNPNDGFLKYSLSDQRWLEKNNEFVDIVPHISKNDLEIHVYRDTDNILKVLISNAFSRKIILTYQDLDRLKSNPMHPKHEIKVAWYKGENMLYIDGALVDIYPKEKEDSPINIGYLFRKLAKADPHNGRIGFGVSRQEWLNMDNRFIEIFPHIATNNIEVHGYRDKDNSFKVMVSNALHKRVILGYKDLDELKENPDHPKHFIEVGWSEGKTNLYIDGNLLDTYPRN